MRGFHCTDKIVANAKCQRVLVLALCLVFRNWPLFNPAKMVTVLYGTKAQHEKTPRTVVLFCNNVKLLGTALSSNDRLACQFYILAAITQKCTVAHKPTNSILCCQDDHTLHCNIAIGQHQCPAASLAGQPSLQAACGTQLTGWGMRDTCHFVQFFR